MPICHTLPGDLLLQKYCNRVNGHEKARRVSPGLVLATTFAPSFYWPGWWLVA